MSRSQNGYPVLDSNETRRWDIPGTNRGLTLHPGDPGFVLTWLAMWFDQRVEPLDRERTWDDWGYAVRPVTGGSAYSNHASGTAMDLNAVQHPYGRPNTFSVPERVKINWVLRVRLRGVVRWGGNYSSTKDDMHFEINAPLSRVNERARALRKTPRGRAIVNANT